MVTVTSVGNTGLRQEQQTCNIKISQYSTVELRSHSVGQAGIGHQHTRILLYIAIALLKAKAYPFVLVSVVSIVPYRLLYNGLYHLGQNLFT